MKNNFLFWILAILITLLSVYYQRITGPTHPIKGEVSISDKRLKYKFYRSWTVGSKAIVKIENISDNINGYIAYKRYKSHDDWDTLKMTNYGNLLQAYLPELQAAGKIEYFVLIGNGNETVNCTKVPVVLRYKGYVPTSVLVFHIIMLFAAMLLSSRAGIEAAFKGKNVYIYTLLTVTFLFIGGLILGPIIQKYAFGKFWTGWPLGNDLTDNKTLISFLFWVYSAYKVKKNKNGRIWVVIASIILLIIYLIPHSVLGSEIDYR